MTDEERAAIRNIIEILRTAHDDAESKHDLLLRGKIYSAMSGLQELIKT